MAWRKTNLGQWTWDQPAGRVFGDAPVKKAIPDKVVELDIAQRQAIALETISAALIKINEKLGGIEMNMRPTP